MSMPTKFRSMNDAMSDLPLSVTEEEDGSFTIEWDENHPVTSVFNSWTEDDFLNAIRIACNEVLGNDEFDRIEETQVSEE